MVENNKFLLQNKHSQNSLFPLNNDYFWHHSNIDQNLHLDETLNKTCVSKDNKLNDVSVLIFLFLSRCSSTAVFHTCVYNDLHFKNSLL